MQGWLRVCLDIMQHYETGAYPWREHRYAMWQARAIGWASR
jgi:hypothetical protein